MQYTDSHNKTLSFSSSTPCIVIIIFFCSLNLESNCQQSDSSFIYNTTLSCFSHYGFVAKHNTKLDHLSRHHFPGLEFKISQGRNGKQNWRNQYHNSEIGLSYCFLNYNNNDYLGDAHAVFSYICTPIIKSEKLSISNELGFGISYLTERFDRVDNYKNIAIGSKINAVIRIGYTFSYKISKTNILAGINLTHFSNGAYRMPNLGLNNLSICTGIRQELSNNSKKKEYNFKKDKTQLRSKNAILIILNWGTYETYPIYGKKHQIYNTSVYYSKHLGTNRGIGFGADLSYKSSSKLILEENNTEIKTKDLISPGINISYEQYISKLSIVAQIGCYVFAKDKSNGPIYNKLSLRYALIKRLQITTELRTHYARAECILWGVGYAL